jgi:hypothetical protein
MPAPAPVQEPTPTETGLPPGVTVDPYVPAPPTMPEPNGFFPGVTPDFSNLDFSGLSNLNLEDMDFSELPVPPPPPPPRIPVIEDMDFTNMPDFSNVPGLADLDFSGLPNYQMPAPTMPAPQAQAPAAPGPFFKRKLKEFGTARTLDDSALKRAIAEMGAVKNQQKSIREALATPAPIYTPPPKMEEMFEDYDYGNPNLRDRGMFGPGR